MACYYVSFRIKIEARFMQGGPGLIYATLTAEMHLKIMTFCPVNIEKIMVLKINRVET